MIPNYPSIEKMNYEGRTVNEELIHPSDKPEEACGVFGVFAPAEDVAKLTYFGLFALQHRGQDSAWIATYDCKQIHLLWATGAGHQQSRNR